jgi:hypothetical protein
MDMSKKVCSYITLGWYCFRMVRWDTGSSIRHEIE